MTQTSGSLGTEKSATTSSAPRRSGRPKSAEKRQQILEASAKLFLQKGFSATSMDNLAGEAGVSKQTLYSHFKNKEELFSAVIRNKLDQYHIQGDGLGLEDADMRTVLETIGTQLVSLLQDEDVVAMHRVVIGEVTSAPQMPNLFYLAGPNAGCGMMQELMLENSDYELTQEEAAHFALDFFNLLKSDFHLRSMLGLDYKLDEQQQRAKVERATSHLMTLLAPHRKT